MEQELPTINIEGTDFIVDVYRFELIEKEDRNNILHLSDWHEKENGYGFYYDTKLKNIPYDPNFRDDTTTYVEIPEFVKMAPTAMSQKYNLPVDQIKNMSDFELMVDQDVYDLRVNKGILPTVDIAGHAFYVDIRMDMLRPKDDFLSRGIVFDQIDHYFSEERNAYLIPYDPKKHEFRELDYDNLTSIPKDIIAIEFPFQRELDPIGWNRKGGWDIKEDLKQIGLKSHFQAKTVPWKETFIHDIISDNLKKMKEKQDQKVNIKTNSKKGKGRKM